MPGELSRSAIDALGKRLRSGTLRDGDEDVFEAVLEQHSNALVSAVALLRTLALADGSPAEVSSRVKTRRTLLEKLQRERLGLSGVQDIAGARIVVRDSLAEQDAIADRIKELFPEVVRTIDRRVDPRSGYRALHVVVRHEGCLVEVQTRTALQDLWAQAFESLADIAGRQLRYGGVPEPGPSAAYFGLIGELLLASSEAVASNERYADIIARVRDDEDDAAGKEWTAGILDVLEPDALVMRSGIATVLRGIKELLRSYEILRHRV